MYCLVYIITCKGHFQLNCRFGLCNKGVIGKLGSLWINYFSDVIYLYICNLMFVILVFGIKQRIFEILQYFMFKSCFYMILEVYDLGRGTGLMKKHVLGE